MNEIRTVAFVGLGDQGAPIARRMLRGGYPLTVWARRRASIDEFAEPSATVAASLAELGAAADLVGVCVRNDDDVRSVVVDGGLLESMRPGGVLALHSTIHPDTCREIAALGKPRRVMVIDAPVSGGRRVAEAGDLTVMVGSDAEVFDVVRPVFETFGRPLRLGPLGSGQLAKLINNTLMSANIGLADAAIGTAEALGLDADVFAGLLASSSGRSGGLATLVKVRAAGRAGALDILAKDIGHFASTRPDAGESECLEAAGWRGLEALRTAAGPSTDA